MSNSFGLVIESLVALLLLLTITYCVLLNRQLKRLKADETSLKATIAELLTATDGAERAIAGLKLAVHDCFEGVGARLSSAERLCARLDHQLGAAENLVGRLPPAVIAPAQPSATDQPRPADPQAMVAAAQAFANRTRSLARDRAA